MENIKIKNGTRVIEITENELWVISMILENFEESGEDKKWAWSSEDWEAYVKVNDYLLGEHLASEERLEKYRVI